MGAEMNSLMIDDIIKEVDENGDGEIDYEEFVHMMMKLSL
jgi:Ca2+-binding EF-hand superfamily protein